MEGRADGGEYTLHASCMSVRAGQLFARTDPIHACHLGPETDAVRCRDAVPIRQNKMEPSKFDRLSCKAFSSPKQIVGEAPDPRPSFRFSGKGTRNEMLVGGGGWIAHLHSPTDPRAALVYQGARAAQGDETQ